MASPHEPAALASRAATSGAQIAPSRKRRARKGEGEERSDGDRAHTAQLPPLAEDVIAAAMDACDARLNDALALVEAVRDGSVDGAAVTARLEEWRDCAHAFLREGMQGRRNAYAQARERSTGILSRASAAACVSLLELAHTLEDSFVLLLLSRSMEPLPQAKLWPFTSTTSAVAPSTHGWTEDAALQARLLCVCVCVCARADDDAPAVADSLVTASALRADAVASSAPEVRSAASTLTSALVRASSDCACVRVSAHTHTHTRYASLLARIGAVAVDEPTLPFHLTPEQALSVLSKLLQHATLPIAESFIECVCSRLPHVHERAAGMLSAEALRRGRPMAARRAAAVAAKVSVRSGQGEDDSSSEDALTAGRRGGVAARASASTGHVPDAASELSAAEYAADYMPRVVTGLVADGRVQLALQYAGTSRLLQQVLVRSLVQARQFAAARRVLQHFQRTDSSAAIDLGNGVNAALVDDAEARAIAMGYMHSRGFWRPARSLMLHGASSADAINVRQLSCAAQIHEFADFLASAGPCIVGVDSEWRPERDAGSWPTSILQLAFPDCVWIVDLLTLSQSEGCLLQLRDPLGALLRSPLLRKCGWGIDTDLRRLALSYPELSSAVCVCIGCIDLSALPGSVSVLQGLDARSLSQLVDLVLGAPLDKDEQTSDWHRRPLRDAQVEYAAIDALCAREVVAALQRRNELDEEWLDRATADIEIDAADGTFPLERRVPDTGAISCAMPPRASDAAVVGSPAVCEVLLRHGIDPASSFVPEEARRDELSMKTLAIYIAWQPAVAIVPLTARLDLRKIAELYGVSRHHVRLATADECQREFGYAPGTVPPFGHSCVTEASIVDARGRTPTEIFAGSGVPNVLLHVTFDNLLRCAAARVADICRVEADDALTVAAGADAIMTSPDGVITTRPCFLVDSMLGRLCKWLRVIGVDSELVNSMWDPARIIEAARRTDRVLLTRDKKVMLRKERCALYFVTANDAPSQLEEITTHFGITVRQEDLMSRCGRCNGDSYIAMTASEAAARHSVPWKVVTTVDEFWECKRCAKLYWQGPKFEDTRDKFMQIFEALEREL